MEYIFVIFGWIFLIVALIAFWTSRKYKKNIQITFEDVKTKQTVTDSESEWFQYGVDLFTSVVNFFAGVFALFGIVFMALHFLNSKNPHKLGILKLLSSW